MTSVHESLTDWEALPAKELDDHRAIAVTVNDTTIDGYLTYMKSTGMKFSQDNIRGDYMEQLRFTDVYQPVIVNLNHKTNKLLTSYKAINILKETK